MPTPRPIFVYGTLLDERLRQRAMGARRLRPARRARLFGFRRLFVANADYPALARRQGSVVDGLLLPAPDAATLLRLDAHEGDEYRRGTVLVRTGGRLRRAETYLATEEARLTRRPWRMDARWARIRENYVRRQFSPALRGGREGNGATAKAG